MTEAYIVEAVRTPVGRRKGGFADVHPLQPQETVQGALAAGLLALVERGDARRPRIARAG